MELFYKIVIFIAIIILILILTYVGILLSEQSSNSTEVGFPPVKNSCPDNWKAIINHNNETFCEVPTKKTQKNAGYILDKSSIGQNTTAAENTFGYDNTTFGKPVINFNSTLWSGSGVTADCAKKQWADTYDILWDGITNYSKCD